MAKNRPESIRLKDFSNADYKVLDELREITRENVYTKAIMRTCYTYLELVKERQELKRELSQLQREVENIKATIRIQLAAKQELEQANKRLSELCD